MFEEQFDDEEDEKDQFVMGTSMPSNKLADKIIKVEERMLDGLYRNSFQGSEKTDEDEDIVNMAAEKHNTSHQIHPRTKKAMGNDNTIPVNVSSDFILSKRL